MKLQQVTLERDLRKPQSSNDMTRAFRANDGYALEVVDGLLIVTHVESGKRRVTSQTWICDGEIADKAEGPGVAKARVA